jgi:hypothetical protein
MKLLDQDEAVCKVRRLALRPIQIYRRWVEQFLRFHHDRIGQWIHPNDMGEPEVKAFLDDLHARHGQAGPRRSPPSGYVTPHRMCGAGATTLALSDPYSSGRFAEMLQTAR